VQITHEFFFKKGAWPGQGHVAGPKFWSFHTTKSEKIKVPDFEFGTQL